MPSVSEALRQTLSSIASGPAAQPGAGFPQLVAALDQLEVHVFDRLMYLRERTRLPPELAQVEAEAEALRARLRETMEGVLEALRNGIRSGRLAGESLTRALIRHAGSTLHSTGYDALDLLVEGLMDVGVPEPERAVREAEMVYYQPTPARAVLEMIERAIRPGDVFCDLGAGLGRVVILVALLSRVRAIGVEVEPSYVEYGRRCVRSLDVPGVELIQADARDASFASSTVFFMYTPFRGAILRRVLDRLAREARTRPITVATFGSCTAEVAKERWLTLEPGPFELAVFRSG